MGAITRRAVQANGVDFHLLEAGSGPLALCLHGFPDTAHTWRHLLPALARAGFHAVAPFQRGYAPSSVPDDGRYQSGVLAADADALHDVLGGDGDAVVIGHDWGAAGAHGAAVLSPERWRRVVTMAVPPGPALGAALLGDLAQLKRSWYMFFFQTPFAEMIVSARDHAFIDMLWRDWSPGFAPDTDEVKRSLADGAHLSAALGYYRATLGNGLRDPALEQAQVATQEYPTQPLLYLHGRNDGCVGVSVVEAARSTMPAHVDVRVIDGAGHFLHLEHPDLVEQHILGFLT
ncbi:MAG: alpha/beta fold hydrolase [Ilumatobacteraceae bacterium]